MNERAIEAAIRAKRRCDAWRKRKDKTTRGWKAQCPHRSPDEVLAEHGIGYGTRAERLVYAQHEREIRRRAS